MAEISNPHKQLAATPRWLWSCPLILRSTGLYRGSTWRPNCASNERAVRWSDGAVTVGGSWRNGVGTRRNSRSSGGGAGGRGAWGGWGGGGVGTRGSGGAGGG